MRTLPAFLLALSALSACQKGDQGEDLVPELPCGNDGARMEATIGGNEWCANGSVIASAMDATVLITGVSMSAGTLILEIDSMAMGEQQITEAGNELLFNAPDGSWTLGPGEHGTLIINTLDLAAHKARGTAEVDLRLNGEGDARHLLATFDITWSGD